MKLFIKIIILTLLSSFIFSGCKKYEDGPLISFRTKKARLCGDWKIGSATNNGSDVTAAYQALITEFNIKKDGTYEMKGPLGDDSGKWEFGEDKDDVTFTSSDPKQIPNTYRILRLKHEDVWLRETESNGDIVEIHLK